MKKNMVANAMFMKLVQQKTLLPHGTHWMIQNQLMLYNSLVMEPQQEKQMILPMAMVIFILVMVLSFTLKHI